jgi:transposase
VIDRDQLKQVGTKYKSLRQVLDERSLRTWAASEAMALGYGGIAGVARATGMGRRTIWVGVQEIKNKELGQSPERTRRKGAGRKKLIEQDPRIAKALKRIVESSTRGDPMRPLLWTSKSARNIVNELCAQGFEVSHSTVLRLLKEMDYRLKAPKKTKEGKQHPDRDGQFRYINRRVRAFQRKGQPVISIDTKKKELVGEFYNKGREWHGKGEAPRVGVHDFPSDADGKAIPYGIYDVTRNEGWVSVGIDHDTAEFAVHSIQQWWRHMGSRCYPNADELLIVADNGGSNGARTRLFKVALQQLADMEGLRLTVCHYPPGTSKWNKIEHRMFAHISHNWRGRPLVNYQTVVNLIANTTTKTGLRIRARLDRRKYQTGIKITDEELADVRISRDAFHGDWNYRVTPH